jgi:hypothetical protein
VSCSIAVNRLNRMGELRASCRAEVGFPERLLRESISDGFKLKGRDGSHIKGLPAE